METILKYIKKYPMFFIGIVVFIALFIISMVKGVYATGMMIIPLLLVYIFWLCTEIDRNDAWDLLEKVVNHYEALNEKYNHLIDEYNELVDDYNRLEEQVNNDTVEVETVDDQTES